MARLFEQGGKFIWRGTFAEYCARQALLRENMSLDVDGSRTGFPRAWFTEDALKADELRADADPHLKARLRNRVREARRLIAASRAASAEGYVPAPPGQTYRPFQIAGIKFLWLRYKAGKAGAGVWDEMGLGKTVEVLGFLNLLDAYRELPPEPRILLIARATLKRVWLREARKWLIPYREGRWTMEVGNVHYLPPVNVPILNFEAVRAHKAALDFTHWHVVGVDEAHYLKNPQAQRTVYIMGGTITRYGEEEVRHPVDNRHLFNQRVITNREEYDPIPAGFRIPITGSPQLNSPMDMWPLLNWADPVEFPADGFHRYAARYGAGRGQDPKHLAELQRRVRTIAVRRLKIDVLPELPPKQRQIVEVEAPEAMATVRAELEAARRHRENLRQLTATVQALREAVDRNAAEYQEAVRQLRAAEGVAWSEMSRLRHLTALAKVPYVIDFVQQLIEAGEKPLVFAHHVDVLEKIYHHFGERRAVLIHGGIPEECGPARARRYPRQEAQDRFNEDDGVDLAVLGIQLSVGITLLGTERRRSRMSVFGELDWVPPNLTQAEDRNHRIGQQQHVNIYHLVFDGSLDVTMAQRVIEKQEASDQSLDREEGAVPVRAATAADLRQLLLYGED